MRSDTGGGETDSRKDATPYLAKGADYFHAERRDFIDVLPADASRRALEIGCGDGATGAYAKRTGKCGEYVGIELVASAAAAAAKVLDRVFVANIETFEFPPDFGMFDVVIASEVLEHLVDPWEVLRRLRTRMRPGARFFASSPNVAHHSMLTMLLRGDWDLAASGRMDRTHLRWFTPRSYAQMFRDCGFEVTTVRPLLPLRPKARIANALLRGRYEHLFVSQIVVEARVAGG